MKEICDLIPDSFHELDLELTGWHCKCYQSFAKNINRLKPSLNYCTPELQRQSLRKSTPLTFLFSKNECLFCGKNWIKPGKKELPDKNFVSWTHKRFGWENIAAIPEHMQHI